MASFLGQHHCIDEDRCCVLIGSLHSVHHEDRCCVLIGSLHSVHHRREPNLFYVGRERGGRRRDCVVLSWCRMKVFCTYDIEAEGIL